MLKQGGEWKEVDWQTALEYVANGLQGVKAQHGAQAIGTLASPHSTAEELFLAASLTRGLGSQNIDTRLRAADFHTDVNSGHGAVVRARWLGTSVASLSTLQRVLVIGSNVRKDQPLLAQRLRQAARNGGKINALNAQAYDWAMPVANTLVADAANWVQALADIAAAVGAITGAAAPVAGNANSADAQAIAKSLMGGERKAILLGNAAAHHAKASSLLSLANWIGGQAGATVGYLGEAANTVGAQLVGALPNAGGQNAGQMLAGGLKAVLLLNTEPAFDAAHGADAAQAIGQADMVVTMSPFKANMDISDVLLPISPFTETAGTFINTEGRAQSFHGVVKPLGETRPAWKVLRVLGSMLHVPGFDFETIEEVRAQAIPADVQALLSNACAASVDVSPVAGQPATAAIYQLDSLVRRAPSLQLTADAQHAAVDAKQPAVAVKSQGAL
jgi:NADH-quinone oxidoreductase subunit G